MTYDLTPDEVTSILDLIYLVGNRLVDEKSQQGFALAFAPLVEKLDPEGWAAAGGIAASIN